jgi:hypothetical protein
MRRTCNRREIKAFSEEEEEKEANIIVLQAIQAIHKFPTC